MKRFHILMTLVIIFLTLTKISYANNEIVTEQSIDSNITLLDYNVNISGKITNITEPGYVTLLLKKGNKLIFADQTICESDGTFSFDFVMAEEFSSGTYSYVLGSSLDTELHTRSFEYTKPVNTEMSADVMLSGRNIIISGKIYDVTEPCYVSLLIKKGDKIVLADQITSSPDGTFSFDFKMPKSCTNGTYIYYIRSSSTEKRFVESFKYSKPASRTITAYSQVDYEFVKITGEIYGVDSSEELTLVVEQKEKTLLTQKVNSDEYGQFVFEFELPYGYESGACDYYIESDSATNIYHGTFICKISNNEPDKAFKTLNVTKGQIIPCFIQINNIQNIIDKKIVIQYEGDFVGLYDACFFTSARETSACEIEHLGIVIESVSYNEIVMSFNDNYIGNKTDINTLFNGINFIGKKDAVTRVTCTITNK